MLRLIVYRASAKGWRSQATIRTSRTIT